MYPPSKYQINDIAVLHDFINKYGFATLIMQQNEQIEISHVPLLLEQTTDNSDLLGHIANNNPQCKMLATGCQVTAIFHGPHAYISPAWYKPGFTAPTWNFTAVHVQGYATLINDKIKLESMLQTLIHKYESNRSQPWQMDWANAKKEKLLAAISGFTININTINGRFNLSQDENSQTLQNIIANLADNEDIESKALANYMQAYYRNL